MIRRNATRRHDLFAWLACSIAFSGIACSGDDDPAGAGGVSGASAMAGTGGASGAAGGGQGGASGAAGGGQGGVSGMIAGMGGASGAAGSGAGQGGSSGAPNDAGMMDSAVEPDAAIELPTTWTTGMAMPTVRTEIAVAELNGLVYVAGGYGGMTAFEVYDPENDSWDSLAELPVGLEHPSLGALSGLIYLTGGGGSATYAYDPGANAWSERAPLIYPRHAAAMVALDGALYLVGGTGPSDRVLQRYDVAGDAWEPLAELSVTRDHVAAVVLNGKIYALAGRLMSAPGAPYTSVEIYDPGSNMWMPGVDMQDSRSGLAAAVVGGQIYVAGGEVLDLLGFSVRDTVERFDPVAGQWHYEAMLPVQLHGTGAVGLGNRMLIFGGASNPAAIDPRTGIVYIYGP
jgi:N-acetylneuraminic acid mutarotase